MREIYMSGSGLDCINEFHERLAHVMEFPEWYGKNLDALKDMLTDIGEDTRLIISNSADMEASLGTFFLGVCRVLTDAALENPYFTFRLD